MTVAVTSEELTPADGVSNDPLIADMVAAAVAFEVLMALLKSVL